ncbi:hypothetical protein SDC9_162461 [bioreactor metagenome]|uniref:Uncharacterized protein n=1 Tax=bioreactor metagenome TaxID=1076179 RepID=A0A645FNH7_9ZZZZ
MLGCPCYMGQRRFPAYIELSCNRNTRFTGNVETENLANNPGLPRFDRYFFPAYDVAVHSAQSDDLTLLHLLSNPPLTVLRNRPALFLCKRREDGEHELAVP